MRKSLMFLSVFLFGMSHAQKAYESILQEGLVWKIEYRPVTYIDNSENLSYENLVLHGDTLIDDIPFKWAYNVFMSDTGDSIWELKNFLIGQKEGRVYQYEESGDWSQKCNLIMDFSLDVGDELTIYDENQQLWLLQRFKVVAVSDTILDSSYKQPRRCVHVENDYTGYKDCWVEGIGSLADGIIGLRRYYPGSYKQLIMCLFENEVLYSSEYKSSICNHCALTIDNDTPHSFFDLQGRRLTIQPRRGLYIRDGRKYVAR